MPAGGKFIHGHKKRGAMSPTYRTWLGIKRRCSDPRYKDFANYGAKGIRVCPEWDQSFEQFLRDMGERPAGLTIDRINPWGDYAPGNCRWVEHSKQASENKTTLKPLIVNGMSFSSRSAACRYFGVSKAVAQFRINAGIPEDVAVSQKGRLKPRRSRESYLPKSHPDRAA